MTKHHIPRVIHRSIHKTKYTINVILILIVIFISKSLPSMADYAKEIIFGADS